MLNALRKDLRNAASPERAARSAKFFKTGKGEYCKGDRFLGLAVPEVRKVARRYRNLPHATLEKLITSPFHEERLTALLILVEQYQKASEVEKQQIVDFYLSHLKGVNNWDLVDASADKILGSHLFGHDTALLDQFAASNDLWKQRIAIIATFYFIKHNQFEMTFCIAKKLIRHKHDLIHKAVGWMLREVGKRDQKALEQFLAQHYKNMPRTMLRYAIERFSADKRQRYLRG